MDVDYSVIAKNVMQSEALNVAFPGAISYSSNLYFTRRGLDDGSAGIYRADGQYIKFIYFCLRRPFKGAAEKIVLKHFSNYNSSYDLHIAMDYNRLKYSFVHRSYFQRDLVYRCATTDTELCAEADAGENDPMAVMIASTSSGDKQSLRVYVRGLKTNTSTVTHVLVPDNSGTGRQDLCDFTQNLSSAPPEGYRVFLNGAKGMMYVLDNIEQTGGYSGSDDLCAIRDAHIPPLMTKLVWNAATNTVSNTW